MSLIYHNYGARLHDLGLPTLEYRCESTDVIQVYKILLDIDKVDKSKLFSMSEYTANHGHSLKLFKGRSRLQIRANYLSNRVVDTWNSLPESVVQTPSLTCFKSRLNKWWQEHPSKFDPACYIPSQTTRRYYPNASGSGSYHTGPSFNRGTENTIKVSKFKHIGFEKSGGF